MEDKYIARAWKNKSQPGSLKALSGFAKAKKLKPDRALDVKLSNIYSYSVHRPVRVKYPTRAAIIKNPGELWFTDLADFQLQSRSNKGYNWLLVVIDGFTKKGYTEILKHKTTKEVASAFEKIIKRAKKPPVNCLSDQGLEYMGADFQALMKKYKINHYTSKTKRKSFQAERFIRTLKSSIYRHFTETKKKEWISVIDDIVTAYNNTKHSTTQYAPNMIKPGDWGQVFLNSYKRIVMKKKAEPKFRVGDRVRVAKTRIAFQKGYQQGYGPQIFLIKSIIPFSYPVAAYKLQSLDGLLVSSSFVEQELSYADQNVS